MFLELGYEFYQRDNIIRRAMMHIRRLRWLSAALALAFFLGVGFDVASRLTSWSPVASAYAQEEGADEEEAPPDRPETFWDYYKQGGMTMWPLLGTAIWVTSVLVELGIKLRVKYFAPEHVVAQITNALEVADYQKAWRVAAENPSPLSRVFCAAIEKLPKGREALEGAAGEAAMDENNAFRVKISYLSLNAAVAPMLGLFGTISGMISAFNQMAYEGAVGDPTKLAGSIGEALITTYAGLVVAIPAMTIYYVVGNMLKGKMSVIQNHLSEFVDMIHFESISPDLVVVTREMKAKILGGEVAAAKGGRKGPPAGGAKSTSGSAGARTTGTGQPPMPPPPSGPAAAAAATPAQMVNCPNCKASIAVGTKKCPGCGTELDWE